MNWEVRRRHSGGRKRFLRIFYRYMAKEKDLLFTDWEDWADAIMPIEDIASGDRIPVVKR